MNLPIKKFLESPLIVMWEPPRSPFLVLKREFERTMIATAAWDERASDIKGRSSMEPSKQRDYELTWTPVEKKTARKAFDKAFERHCAAITAEVRRMLESATAPADIWRVQEYLSENRKTVDRIYCYRYSGLILIFSILMRDGWLTEADLEGLQEEKIARIKLGARL